MGQIVISYSRRDDEFVKRLERALHDKGRDTWKDEHDIPKGADWFDEIKRNIDRADAVAFVISPNWIASEICAKELAHAVERKKRIIPLLAFAVEPKHVPEALSKLNWIPFTDEARFETSVLEVIQTADTDLDWVRELTRLLTRATDWESRQRDTSYTLRGTDLKSAESLLMRAVDKDPKPNALQTEYVLESRKASIRRQRITLASIAVALIVVTLVSVVAFFQRRERQRQEIIAGARHLINKAQAMHDPDAVDPQGGIEQSVCDAAEALSRFQKIGMYSVEADVAVREGMAMLAESAAHELSLGEVRVSAFDATGQFLTAIDNQSNVVIWDTVREHSISVWKVNLPVMQSIRAAEISADGRRLATLIHDASQGRGTYTIRIWDVAQRKPLADLPEQEGVMGLRLSAKGEYIYALRGSAAVGWHVSDGSPLPGFPENLVISDLAFSPDDQLIATAIRDRTTNDRFVRISTVATAEERTRWTEEHRTSRVRWTADSKAVISSNGDAANVRNAATGEVLAKFTHADSTPAWSHVGYTMAERDKGRGYAAVLMDREGKQMSRLPHSKTINAMAFRPDGASLVTLSDGTVRIWKLHGGHSFADLIVDPAIEQIGFTADSSAIYAASSKQRSEWRLPATPDGLSSPAALQARTAEVQNSDANPPVRFGNDVISSDRSPDGRYWIVLRQKSTRRYSVSLEIWDSSGQKRLHEVMISDPPAWAFSSDMRTIAIPDNNGFTFLALDTMKPVRTIYHPYPAAIACQPGGDLVGTAGRDRSIRIWQLHEGPDAPAVEIARLQAGSMKAISLSPDARWVGTLDRSGNLQLWLLAPGDLVTLARTRVRDRCQPRPPTETARR